MTRTGAQPVDSAVARTNGAAIPRCGVLLPNFDAVRSGGPPQIVAAARLAEELGYEIDAYSIQHEMSTHYGRMVATDDALVLFSDPTEAMKHLIS